MFYFYIPEGLSGVTSFYVHVIEDALASLGEECVLEKKLRNLPRHAKVVTITDKAATLVALFKKPDVLINWYQGISPEEMNIIYKGKLVRLPRYLIRKLMVAVSLRYCDLNLFVSSSMRDHHRRNYGYDRSNYFLMPCFGNTLDDEAFTSGRYSAPSFLYSGTAVGWQCMDRMLDLFAMIKNRIPSATLSILTPDREIAEKLVAEKKVDASIDFVKPEMLQGYIRKFKYGFIVRDDIAVNRVATPTKMSNYMGAGIIPIYSDVVDAYKENITGRSPYIIPFLTAEECIEKIVAMEQLQLSGEEVRASYNNLFDTYWNRERYVRDMADKIKSVISREK